MVCEMNTESLTYNRNYRHLTTEQPLNTPPIGYMLIHALFPHPMEGKQEERDRVREKENEKTEGE